MSESHNFQNLKAAILALSVAKDWSVAKAEWTLVNVEEADDLQTCPCGHYPIKQLCVLKNRINSSTIEVGNVCVKRFIGLRSDLVFDGIARIRADDTRSLGVDATILFYHRGVLSQWEYEFQTDTMKKRALSSKQMLMRQRINQKVLAATKRQGIS
jgi:hypothetical protein